MSLHAWNNSRYGVVSMKRSRRLLVLFFIDNQAIRMDKKVSYYIIYRFTDERTLCGCDNQLNPFFIIVINSEVSQLFFLDSNLSVHEQ